MRVEGTAPGWRTIQGALKQGSELLRGAGIESARLDAEVLLATILARGREALYARPDRILEAAEDRRYQDWLGRRARREPVAYIVGAREFWSLDFAVGAGVLIPRPETELLVELALQCVMSRPLAAGPCRVLDVCTGCGAIAVSLATERADLEIWASDVAPEAVRLARLNAATHGVQARARVLGGDLFAPVAEKKNFFDVIVSNPPYVCRPDIDHLPVDVRDWEPRLALDGGADGLAFYRRIVAQAGDYLTPDALLLMEIAPASARSVLELLAATGSFRKCQVHTDYCGRSRAVSARKLP